jgi:diguanylate cyclase (GGDEF)-like protein/PAS domain S-box-containing protein
MRESGQQKFHPFRRGPRRVSRNKRFDRSYKRLIEESQAKLREQHQLLQAAVDNMTDGLIMFDGSARVVVCNRRYLEMYHASPEIVKPGLALRDLLIHRKATGGFFGDIDEYIADSLASTATRNPSIKIKEFADGRVIQIKDQPMPSGGWVAIHEDITERRRAERRIAHMAHYDSLTDLPNRALFFERLRSALSCVPTHGDIAVLYLDVDRFKVVNDTYGHAVGDRLLKGAAGRLRRCARAADTVARLGGDEFAIIQSTIHEPADAAVLASRILDEIGTPFEFDGHRLAAGVSIGIAIAPRDGLEEDKLLSNADVALYASKARGRGTYRFFSPDMEDRNYRS